MARKSYRLSSDDDFALGRHAVIEPQRARRRRLKARLADRTAQEIDRSKTTTRLVRAAKRLKAVRANERILSVPQWNMDKAVEAMRQAGVSGTVTNLCGTRRQKVDGKRRQAAEIPTETLS